jgi:hypothetical protein
MEEDEIFDTNLLIEGKGGLTTIFNVIEYPKVLEREIEILFPEKKDFLKAIEIMAVLLKKGKPIPALDVIIASMCLGRDVPFHTKDKHFEIIRKEFPTFRVTQR